MYLSLLSYVLLLSLSVLSLLSLDNDYHRFLWSGPDDRGRTARCFRSRHATMFVMHRHTYARTHAVHFVRMIYDMHMMQHDAHTHTPCGCLVLHTCRDGRERETERERERERPEGPKRATSGNAPLPCLQRDLRTGSISRDFVNFTSDLHSCHILPFQPIL